MRRLEHSSGRGLRLGAPQVGTIPKVSVVTCANMVLACSTVPDSRDRVKLISARSSAEVFQLRRLGSSVRQVPNGLDHRARRVGSLYIATCADSTLQTTNPSKNSNPDPSRCVYKCAQ
jgi:hypothetical protein